MAPIDLQRPRDLGRILDDAFALYRQNWRTLLAVAVVVVVPVQLVVFGVGLGWLTAGYDAKPTVGAQLVGIAAQLLVVTPLVTAMTVHVVRTAAEDRRAGAGEALSAGLAVFPGLFAAVVLVALGVSLGLLALLLPGVLLAVRLAVVPQVVVVEGRRGGDALRRSFDLVRGQGWFAFGLLVVTNLIVGLLSLLVTIPLDAAARSADTQSLSLVAQMLGGVLSLPLLGVAQTLLYFSLRERSAERPVDPDISGSSGRSSQPATLPGVPGTFGAGYEPPTPPDPDPARRS